MRVSQPLSPPKAEDQHEAAELTVASSSPNTSPAMAKLADKSGVRW